MRNSFGRERIPAYCESVRYGAGGRSEGCTLAYRHDGRHSFDLVCDGSDVCRADFHDPECRRCRDDAEELLAEADGLAAKYGHDPVSHPSHYRVAPPSDRHPHGIEAIDVTQLFNFNVGNALKYLLRHGKKFNKLEDLQKAKQYIDFEINRINKGE